MRRRRPLPSAIKDAPRLWLGSELFFDAFLDLQGDRSGDGTGPIPWTCVNRYAREIELGADDRDDLHFYVRAMDEAWLEWYREKRKQEEAAGARGKTPRVGPKPKGARR